MAGNEMAVLNAIKRMQANALNCHPDTKRYKCRHEIRSQSSDSVYMVSFDAAEGAGYWVCSCFGYRRHGHCKHLDASGLIQRGHGKKDLATIQALGI